MKLRFIATVLFPIMLPAVFFAQAADTSQFTLTKSRKYSWFASDRSSEDGKYDVYRIGSTSDAASIVIVRGHFEVIGNPALKKARISVFNASNDQLVGLYNTNPNSGNYLVILVPNVKYIFQVEVQGYDKIQQVVEVPQHIDYEVCRQEIKIKSNESGKPLLIISNWFAEENDVLFLLTVYNDSTAQNLSEYVKMLDKPSPLDAKKKKSYASIDEMVKKQVEEEKKKPAEAEAAFQRKDYLTCAGLYSQLLRYDPADPVMNYRYGVSLFYTEKNKAKAIGCLEAASRSDKVPYDVFLYLGRACHLSYLFSNAIAALEEFRKRAKPADITNNKVTELVNNCKSGKTLMEEQVRMQVLSRTPIDEQNLLSAFNPELVNDRLMYKTEYFYSPYDKDTKEKLLMCRAGRNEIVQVSYGAKAQGGKDLFRNSFTAKEGVPLNINTPYDEDYPYITKDGKTLYFASRGYNSMGGYDIFKCTRKDTSSVWSEPQNLGYPVNSVYDDFLFIPDSSEQYGWFCSDRKGLELIRVRLPKVTSPFSVIKGNFSTLDSADNRSALITVYNAENDELAGTYRTNSETGNYLMVLLSGAKYRITVEADDYPELTGTFEVPEKKDEFTLRQELRARKEGSFRILKVNNYFSLQEAQKVPDEYPARRSKPVQQEEKKEELVKEFKTPKPKRTPEQANYDKQVLKQAKGLFEQGNFTEAASTLQNLGKVIDLDGIGSYYLGVSLFNINKDRTTALPWLEAAAASGTAPSDVYYYLGKANHYCYRFSRAVKSFEKFVSISKPDEVKKLGVENEIAACSSGLKLVNNPVVIEVYEKKQIPKQSINVAFSHLESGGMILATPEDMKSSVDKQKKFNSTLFLSADKNTIIFSSYGDNDLNGKDIYKLSKLPDGKWSPVPQKIIVASSPFDDEFPCLSADGKILFFSSRGFNSMGGYDIFKCMWDERAENWSAPVNLGAPINSPFDDVYFIW